MIENRERTRAARDWTGKVVVLNVCRFEHAERRYKGIDTYAEVARRFREARPELASRVDFVLCGKAASEDVKEVEALGLTVVANASDQELADLYAAADVYMNFSRWEGYNLGIGQALAMGLPVIASDIQAHRDFGVTVTNDPGAAAVLFGPLADAALSGTLLLERRAKLWTWDRAARRVRRCRRGVLPLLKAGSRLPAARWRKRRPWRGSHRRRSTVPGSKRKPGDEAREASRLEVDARRAIVRSTPDIARRNSPR